MEQQKDKQQRTSKTEELLTAILVELKIITADLARRNAEREQQSRPLVMETATQRSIKPEGDK